MKIKKPIDLQRSLALQDFWKRSRCHLIAVGLALTCAGGFVSCSEYDLDENTPAGWDRSIYSWLDEQGDFTTMVKLINDLDYRDVLAKTGSKTLFAADDQAFDRFFKNNSWGVKKYEDLTVAQKRKLLFGAMINNSYQVQALSSTPNASGTPVEGDAMRRSSALEPFDNVQILEKKDIPNADYWSMYQGRDSLVVLHDATETPMIHFIERYMVNKQITNEDYDFLYNHTTHRQSGDASVNGAQIVEQNIRCLNGFINRMSEVVTPLPNMADIIMSKPNTTVFAHLLNRYSVLDCMDDETKDAYNASRGTHVDSVFQLRYFSERSQGKAFNKSHNQVSEDFGELPYDPGWNSYNVPSNSTGSTAMQQDMAVMLVPSDEALNKYWEEGAGAALRKSFGSWDNVPYSTLTEFMSANMLESLSGSVPSKFQFILNDAADPMGIKTTDVDSVWLACNGAIYLTNRVFTPTSFVSVMYPTVVDKNMSIMLWAIKKLNYQAYLNSLNARYSFFLPSNKALLEYVDPCSYGKPQRQMLRFHYDSDRKGNEVYASIHNIDPETGVAGDSVGVYTNSNGTNLDLNPILNRLYTILDDHVVIGNVEDGHEYYRTKGGSILRVKNAGQSSMLVEGTRQINGETPSVPVSYIYDQTPETQGGNGKSYILEQGPVLGTRQTVFNILGQHPEFKRFHDLLASSELVETKHDKKFACSDSCISTFNNFHYTVYVPTNESIDQLIADGDLHTWDDVAALDTTIAEQNTLYHQYVSEIDAFLRYHIQDNAIVINADNTTGMDKMDSEGNFTTPYETAYLATEKTSTGKIRAFKKLNVKTNEKGSDIWIIDAGGNTRKVVKTPGLYNLMAREFTYAQSEKSQASIIHNSSTAVVHLIDGPLMTKKKN